MTEVVEKAVTIDGKTSLDVLVKNYANARRKREVADAAVKTLRESESQAEVALFDAMEALGLRSIKHAKGTFYLNDQAWASVADEAAAREWALNEHPEIITLNRSRLSAMVRGYLEENEELPPGVSYTTTRKVGWRDRR